MVRYTLIHVLMLYGIRRGECAGIKLSAVDLRGKTITICSCVMYDPKNGVYEKPYPKKRKPRQLPITPQMDEILRRYLKCAANSRNGTGISGRKAATCLPMSTADL